MPERLQDTILPAGTAYGYGRDVAMVSLAHGGQDGFEIDFTALNSSQQYVRRHLIPLLVAAPRLFQLLPNATDWVAGLKAVLEVHPRSWEGLNMKLTAEFVSRLIGGAGEELETVSDMKRARSQPVAAYIDLAGRPISTFWDQYLLMCMMDPNTKVPNILTMLPAGTILDFLPDMMAFSMLFFEPDPTFTKIDKAWLCCNMMPREGADISGRRDIHSPMDQLEFNIEFTAVTQVGFGVNQLAGSILSKVSLNGTNPNLRPAFVAGVDADVAAATTGIADGIAQAGANAVAV